jgi:branched-subunit amino acid ABC-type transport system permease component
MDSQLLLSGVIFGLSMASVYFLMSIGLSLCFGLMRIISLDQLLYYAVGAYLTYTVSTASGNVWLGVLAGVAISGTLALLVERFVFRRIYERELTFSMITSFGILIGHAPIKAIDITHKQSYGKIAPIDEQFRRFVVEHLSQKHSIYSLGRFATWRNILLDDVLKDLQVIKKLMNADLYSRKIHSLQV